MENEQIIITHESNPTDWEWLRSIYDGYFMDFCSCDWATGSLNSIMHYTSRKMAGRIGVEPREIIPNNYNVREFKVVNNDKFMRAKLSR